MTEPDPRPDHDRSAADDTANPAQLDKRDGGDAVIDDASPDPRNGAVGGTDGITKNQDDTAQ